MAIKWYYPIHRAEAKEEKRISQSANDELANIMKSIEDIQNMPQPTKGKIEKIQFGVKSCLEKIFGWF